MFIFAGTILLFAFCIYRGYTELVRSFEWAKYNDKEKAYKNLGKCLALTSTSPLISGLIGLTGKMAVALVAFFVVFILDIVLIVTKQRKKD